jgi:transposase
MLKLPSLGELDRGVGVRIYLCTSPTDMRKGFDTLAAVVKEFLGQDPLSGHLFLFVGRAKDRLKILYWDADGFALWYKRLEEGTFKLPRVPTESGPASPRHGVELKASELAMLLEGIDLKSIKRTKRYEHGTKTSAAR